MLLFFNLHWIGEKGFLCFLRFNSVRCNMR